MKRHHWHRHPAVRTEGQLSFAERAADAAVAGMGSWGFLGAQTVFITAWIVLNVLALTHHWDPYPFILLNLAFSTQAAYAAPLILLAQRRQDVRTAEVAMHTLDNTATLTQLLETNTTLTREVKGLTEQVHLVLIQGEKQ